MKKSSVFVLLSIIAIVGLGSKTYNLSVVIMQNQERNYVPDEKTAIAVSEAVWLPVFGEKIYKSKPFTAILDSELVWTVKGTLNAYKGGVPYCRIQKKDGKILSVYHTK